MNNEMIQQTNDTKERREQRKGKGMGLKTGGG